ncbi:MAG: hypothetical protein Tsb005_02070 [Gammaproteobacteria bacterium]
METRINADLEALDKIKSTRKDDTISKLEERNQALQDKINEERFYWICLIIIICDFFFFRDMKIWASPIVMLVLQLLILIPLARRLGVDTIYIIFNKFLDSWQGKNQASS